MEHYFTAFLREQGIYEHFTHILRFKTKQSLQCYCRVNYWKNYMDVLKISPLYCGVEVTELRGKWLHYFGKIKKEVLYTFLVREGVLFPFLNCMVNGLTFDSFIDSVANFYTVFNHNRLLNKNLPLNTLNKKWREYLKERNYH